MAGQGSAPGGCHAGVLHSRGGRCRSGRCRGGAVTHTCIFPAHGREGGPWRGGCNSNTPFPCAPSPEGSFHSCPQNPTPFPRSMPLAAMRRQRPHPASRGKAGGSSDATSRRPARRLPLSPSQRAQRRAVMLVLLLETTCPLPSNRPVGRGEASQGRLPHRFTERDTLSPAV